MASGGHFSLPQSRNSKQSSGSSARHARGEPCDSLDPPWLLTANNLDLHASATEPRLSKKQRNKNKTRSVPVLESPISSESSPRVPCQKAPSSLFACSKFSPVPRNEVADAGSAGHQWQSDYGEADSDTEESNVQNFQPCQRRGDSLTNGTTVKKAVQDSFAKVNKQDNTKKLPNTSKIVERLMHLRDCISQVTSIMQNLEKSDEPCTREQMGRLDGMLDQLRHEEQEHLKLLQQVLAARDVKPAQRDRDVTATLSSSSCSMDASSNSVKIKQEELNSALEEAEEVDLENQNPFLQEMIESREKLTAIKEQQATLLNLQKKAENRLAEAKAFHERIMETALPLTDEWNGGLSSELQNGVDFDEVAWDGRDDVDAEVVQIPQPPPRKGHRGEDRSKPLLSVDIDSIQHRLHLLKEVADNRKLAEVMSVAEENMSQDEKTTERHRQQLENKLRKLQEKKHQMDHLLAEISSLQTVSDQNSPPRNQLASKEPLSQNLEANTSNQDAKKYLEVDAQDKLRKLDDMKATLKQLKEMAGNLNISVNAEQDSAEMLQQQVQTQQRRIRSQSQKSTRDKGPPRKPGALKSDNIKKENLSASFPARRHYEAEGRANEDGDNTQAAAAGPATVNGAAEDELEIQEKVQKLQAAKHKLQKLHTLLGAMQHLQQSGEPVPNEFLNILSSLQDEEESDEEDERNIPKQHQLVSTGNNSLESSNDLNQNDMSRLEEVEEKMKQQQVDLEKLVEERGRLLTMKEQLTRLQQQFPSIISKNNRQRSSGEGGSMASRRERQTRQKNLLPVRDSKKQGTGQDPNLFQQNVDERDHNLERHLRTPPAPTVRKEINSKAPNLLSNSLNLSSRGRTNTFPSTSEHTQQTRQSGGDPRLDEFMAELEQSLSLRDELQKQKTVLEELLQQEQKKQLGFSQNQDVQSQSGSSEKSEMLEGSSSVLAPDTTVAATWGGSSTQDNLNDEVEEQLESLDEDEGQDSGSAEENLTESRLHSLAEGNAGGDVQMENVALGQRNSKINRTFNYRRSLLNQWRRNIQPNSSNKNEDQAPYHFSHQETIPPTELNASDLPASDFTQMTKHFQQQLEQTNVLCQSVLRDQHNLTSILMANSSSSHHMLNHPDLLRHYNHQLYQQQQLLLNLSHCYQMLYLQQMEIQHLQQCLQQSPDSESAEIHTSIMNKQLTANEEFNFRPWCIPPWLSPTPISAASTFSPPFIQPSFLFNSGHASANPVSYPTNNSPGPLQNQDGRATSETLNNQVPPGTRANNFLDNFRSYSRQNLLSTASKSNEQLGNNAPPLSVHPRLSPITATLRGSGRPRSFPRSPAVPPNLASRSSTPNVATQNNGARPRVKRPNLSQESLSESPATDRARRIPACLNLFDMPESTGHLATRTPAMQANSSPSTINISLPYHPNQTPRTTDLDTGADQPHLESILGEFQNAIQKQESNPDFLVDLFEQLQLMCSDSQRIKLMSAVKEITGKGNEEHSSTPRTKVESRSKNQPGYSPSEQFGAKSEKQSDAQLPEAMASPVAHHDDQSPIESSSSCASWTKDAVAPAQKKLANKQHTSANHQPYSLSSTPQENSMRRRSSDLDLSTFLESHRYEECTSQLQSQLCSYVLQTLPQHPLRFFRSQLLQGLQQVLVKYQGQRIRDVESELLMDVNEIVKTELSIHKHMSRQRRERSTESDRNEVPLRIPVHDHIANGFSDRDLGHKDIKVHAEDHVEADSEDGHPVAEGMPETLKAVSRKAFLDMQPDHLEDVRAAPDGIAAAPPPPPLPLQLSPRLMEEESGYDCDAEGETEPELEAETEVDDTQDLAEADQSAGQRAERMCLRENAVGAAAATSHVRSAALSPPESGDPVHRHQIMNGDVTYPEDVTMNGDVPREASAAEGDGAELTLDDIPTKLAPLSQDELQRHITEENAENSLFEAILADHYGGGLFGDDDNIREPGAL